MAAIWAKNKSEIHGFHHTQNPLGLAAVFESHVCK